MKASYLRAAHCLEVEETPIWMMRQAGRFMASFQKIRQRYSFIELVKTPELATHVTLMPIHAFSMSAAILFSDITVIADALDLGLRYKEGFGPSVERPIQSQQDVDRLVIPDKIEEKLSYVMEAIKMTKQELDTVPLIGFAGAPFTVMTYLLKDNLSRRPRECMKWILGSHSVVHSFLDTLSCLTASYLNAQIKAGVDAIQLFESQVLSWSLFTTYALPYLKKVIQRLENPKNIPITLFGTSFTSLYPLLQDIGAHVISFDSRMSILKMRQAIAPHIAVQGNLDPYYLLAPKELLKKEVMAILESMEGQRGFIFNLGHGVFPEVPEDHVKFVVDIVRNFDAKRAQCGKKG